MSRASITAKLVDASVVSTTVGTWVCQCDVGQVLVQGQVLGRLLRAGHWMNVLAPSGVRGRVSKVCVGHTPVQFGTVLIELSDNVNQEHHSRNSALPDGMVEVNAPMAGTIYLQPSPNEPVFVPVGGQVQKSETIALIEVMKSLTPIRAGLNGTVERWLVDDAAAVDAGDIICWIGR